MARRLRDGLRAARPLVAAALWLCAAVALWLQPRPAQACRLYGATFAGAPQQELEQHLIGDASEHPTALKRLGGPLNGNTDGWGLIQMRTQGDAVVVQRSAASAAADPAFDAAVRGIDTAEPGVVLAHVRNCTSGCCAHGAQTVENPHPFLRLHGGRAWTFAHKGTVSKERLLRLMGPTYLRDHALTGSGIVACDPTRLDLVVDSELLFLYLLKSVEQTTGAIEAALARAVAALLIDGEWGEMTFIISDGATLWAHGSGSFNGALYLHSGPGTTSVAVEPPTLTGSDWQPMPAEHIATLQPGQPLRLASIAELIASPLLVNPGFESWVRSDGAQVPAVGDLRDWYVSSGADSGIITIDDSAVADNATRKVRFGWPPQTPEAPSAYLTQSFAQPMQRAFALQFDAAVEAVDATGNGTSLHVYVGDDSDWAEADEDCATIDCGPTSSRYERFVSLALWIPPAGPAKQDAPPMALLAQRREDRPDDLSGWPSIDRGLALGQWHTIKLVIEPETCSYSASVVGTAHCAPTQLPANSCFSALTHISFAQCCGGGGVFYVDNVRELHQVIDVVGTTRADAAAQLTATGLRVGAVRAVPTAEWAPGIVLAQDPAAGAWEADGTVVDLQIAESLAAGASNATPIPPPPPPLPAATARSQPNVAFRGNTLCLLEATLRDPEQAAALDLARWLRDHLIRNLPAGELLIALYYDVSHRVLTRQRKTPSTKPLVDWH